MINAKILSGVSPGDEEMCNCLHERTAGCKASPIIRAANFIRGMNLITVALKRTIKKKTHQNKRKRKTMREAGRKQKMSSSDM